MDNVFIFNFYPHSFRNKTDGHEGLGLRTDKKKVSFPFIMLPSSMISQWHDKLFLFYLSPSWCCHHLWSFTARMNYFYFNNILNEGETFITSPILVILLVGFLGFTTDVYYFDMCLLRCAMLHTIPIFILSSYVYICCWTRDPGVKH